MDTGTLYQKTENHRRTLDSLLPKILRRNGTVNFKIADRETLSLISDCFKAVGDGLVHSETDLAREVERIKGQRDFFFYGRHRKTKDFYFFKMTGALSGDNPGGAYLLQQNGRLTCQRGIIEVPTLRELSGGDEQFIFPGCLQQVVLNGDVFLGHRGNPERDPAYYFVQKQMGSTEVFRSVTCRLVPDLNNPDRVECGKGIANPNYTGVSKRMSEIIQSMVDGGKMVKSVIPWKIPPKKRKDEPLQEIFPDGPAKTSGLNAY